MTESSDEGLLPVYAIRMTERAARDITAAFVYVSQTTDEGKAREWRRYLGDTIATIATLPNRCPASPESNHMKPPVVRQLVYRRTSASSAWRILFRAFDASGNDAAYVEVVAVLHGARRPLTRTEAREIDSQR